MKTGSHLSFSVYGQTDAARLTLKALDVSEAQSVTVSVDNQGLEVGESAALVAVADSSKAFDDSILEKFTLNTANAGILFINGGKLCYKLPYFSIKIR